MNVSFSAQSVPLRPMDRSNRWDVIGTFVFSILFVPAVGLSIHYDLHPQIMEGSSLNVPLLVCNGFGLVTAVILLVQIARHQSVRDSFSKWFANRVISSSSLQRLIRKGLYYGMAKTPSGKIELGTYDDPKTGKYEALSIKTRDHIDLRSYWRHSFPNNPTVIFFHGNTDTAERARERLDNFYKFCGCNTLFIEYRGYGESNGEAALQNSEKSAYFDVEAAMGFVRKQTNAPIIAHGFSLGGAYAAMAGGYFGADGVILDHSFTSLRDVISNVLPINQEDAQAIVRACFPTFNVENDKEVPANGFDSAEKLKMYQSKLLVIHGIDDSLMPTKKAFNGTIATMVKGTHDRQEIDTYQAVQNFIVENFSSSKNN